jgi:hypothetical protein
MVKLLQLGQGMILASYCIEPGSQPCDKVTLADASFWPSDDQIAIDIPNGGKSIHVVGDGIDVWQLPGTVVTYRYKFAHPSEGRNPTNEGEPALRRSPKQNCA